MDKVAGYPLESILRRDRVKSKISIGRIKILCKIVKEKNSNDLLKDVVLNDNETFFVRKLIKLIEGRVLKLMVYADEMLKISWE